MKRSLLFLLLVSFSLDTFTLQRRKIDEDSWQKTKDVLLSGEVAYSLLGLVLFGVVMRRCWVLWGHKKAQQDIVKKRYELAEKGRQFAKIFTENTQANVMRDEAMKFMQRELNFQQKKDEDKKIDCYYDLDQGLLTVELVRPELRGNPNLTILYNMLQAARINHTYGPKEEIALGVSDRLIDDEDIIKKLTVVI